MDDKPDISELIQLMFVGLIGAYQESEEIVQDFHDKHDRRRRGFILFECLAHQPLHREKNNKVKVIPIIGPFPHRLARRSIYWKHEDIASKIIQSRSPFAEKIYARWNTGSGNNADVEFSGRNFWLEYKEFRVPPTTDPEVRKGLFFAKGVRGFTYENTKNALKGNAKDGSLELLQKLYLPLIEPFGEDETTSLFIPIASSQVFYGFLFACIPHFKTDEDWHLEQLASELRKCIKRYYIPALALIHEHFFENLSYEKLVEAKDDPDKLKEYLASSIRISDELEIDYKSFICRREGEERQNPCFECQHFRWEESSDNTVEKYLHKLWQDRKEGRIKLEESLFFKERIYADPKMLDLLETFLKPSKAKLKKEGDKVPSILVVATSGAGKEDVPKLLKLFGDYYRRGEIYKLNMAALKPEAVAPLAMMGATITGKKDCLPATKVELKGMFFKLREQTHREFEKFVIKDRGLDKAIKCYQHELSLRNKNIQDAINENELIRGLIESTLLTFLEKEGYSDALQFIVKEIEKAKNGNQRILKTLNKLKELCLELYNKKGLLDKLSGIYKKLEKSKANIRELVKKFEPEERDVVKELYGCFPTIVLDELNSLSMDSQGVLLRFLEQAEITPIGDYKDEMGSDGKAETEYRKFITDFLIVGLMNEEPEEITREKAIRFLKRESYIGGLLGDLLYEHILKIRRLRPDLRSRMMRNGTVRIPSLKERRADIPINFYLSASKAKKCYFANGEIRIVMAALDYLMRPDLEWHENFRLLETLTKKVMEIVYEDYWDKMDRGDKIPTINGKDLILIREKHIREAMKEIGMIKEERPLIGE